METTPLPYTIEVEVVRDQFCYCLRLTPQGQYCEESIKDFLQDDSITKWVYGIENPDDIAKKHFHLVIYSPLEITKFRKITREFIIGFFPDRRRGFGNAQYNLQYSKNPRHAISYALKDLGSKEFSGFTDECIECLTEESTPKVTFDTQVELLNKKYKDTSMTDEDYMANYFIIYSTNGRSINPATIYGYLLSIKISKDETQATTLAREYLKRFKN